MLCNRPVVVSQDKQSNGLIVVLEDCSKPPVNVPAAQSIEYLNAAGLLWALEDLAAGAEIVGYQSAWDVAQSMGSQS